MHKSAQMSLGMKSPTEDWNSAVVKLGSSEVPSPVEAFRRTMKKKRGALTGGGISEDHEEEAHHGQTAVLDLSELHVVPLLQLNSRLRRTGFKRLSPIHLPDHLPTFARAERCKAPLADTLQ